MNNMRWMLTVFALVAACAAAPGQGVRINECNTGGSDWCEIANLSGSLVDISGWSLIMNDDPTASTTFTFPANTMLAPFEVAVVSESPTSPTVPGAVQRFTTTNINWAGPTSPNDANGAAALNDALGAGVDLVLFGTPVNTPVQNPPSGFSGTLALADSYSRNSNLDTDSAADWTGSSPSNDTPGLLNPGQSTTAPPTAEFSASQTTVIDGTPVGFIDQSAGSPNAWAWDFENDGTIDSTQQNPTFTYPGVGTYDVSLVVTNANGSDTITKLGFITVVGTPAVSVPYTQDFDSGPLNAEWFLQTENMFGRIQIGTDGTPSPLSGGDALQFDVTTSPNASTNTATLFVDLAASGGGILRYYARETADESDPEDGVFLSDGVTTIQAASHNSLTGTWEEIEIDLTVVAVSNGLSLTSAFQIIFSQRDNFPIPTDGLHIDDVRVLPPPVPDTGQANQSIATLDVNGGLNLNGNAALVGENGPFFSSGSALDLTVTGNPNQPFIVLLGPLNRNNAVFPFGSLDVGLNGPGNLSDVSILMDGATGTGFFDQFAKTDPGGGSNIAFGLAGVPAGLLGTLQAAVFTGDAQVIGLSAAFEFTVTP